MRIYSLKDLRLHIENRYDTAQRKASSRISNRVIFITCRRDDVRFDRKRRISPFRFKMYLQLGITFEEILHIPGLTFN